MEDKYKKEINMMSCLIGRNWGDNFASLKRIFMALIRSGLDYSSMGQQLNPLLRKIHTKID